MGTLKDDIKSQSDWIVKAFAADKFTLDYSIDSMIEVDRFFVKNMKDGRPKKGGRLAAPGFGPILFSIGSYVGETIIKKVKGSEWITDDHDPQGELTASIKLPDGSIIWPIQKVMKRFENGSEDSIYPYVYYVTKDFTNEEFNNQFWTKTGHQSQDDNSKRWWKFW